MSYYDEVRRIKPKPKMHLIKSEGNWAGDFGAACGNAVSLNRLTSKKEDVTCKGCTGLMISDAPASPTPERPEWCDSHKQYVEKACQEKP